MFNSKDKNPLKAIFRKNQFSYGCWVTLANPLVPELLSIAGFDWIAIDMEHSSIDLSDLPGLLISAEANRLVPLVRVGELNPNLIKRIMDAGAYGVIAANVCTAQDAELVVNSVKYPPVGTRGVGLYRAQHYGNEFSRYVKWANEESVVIVQIEHKNAVQNIDEIFSIKGVDAYLIGPYDLSASFGKPGVFDSEEMIEAMGLVLKAAKRHGVVAGFHSVSSDPKLARNRIREGYRFIGYSTDFMFLKDGAMQGLQVLKKRKK